MPRAQLRTPPAPRTVAVDASVLVTLMRVARLCTAGPADGLVQLTQRFGSGEAACLAMAEVNGWIAATDEGRRFRREVVARIGAQRLVGTVELFPDAIRARLLTVAEADAAKATLATRRFWISVSSFGDLI